LYHCLEEMDLWWSTEEQYL